jgi:hypothetical protein
MATQAIYIKNGTSFVWANSTYSPTAGTSLGTYSATYDIDVVDLAAAAARQSIKADLGNPRPDRYVVDCTFEPATDPAAGGYLSFYWSHSESATAGTGNTGLTTGADGAYTGILGGSLADSLLQMQFIGVAPAVVANDADGVQLARVGYFTPLARYGSLVVVNNMSVALHSDSVEFAVRFMPIYDDVQAAA